MEQSEKKALFDVYEVFVQKSQAEFHTHVGSVVAPSPDHALHIARENFLRRDSGVNIWVVPQEHVYATRYEADFFAQGDGSKISRGIRLFREWSLMADVPGEGDGSGGDCPGIEREGSESGGVLRLRIVKEKYFS